MTRSRRYILLALLALPALIGLQACGSDGAEFLGGDTLLFEGSILPEEDTSRHDFVVVEVGLVEFHLDRLVVADPETGELVEGGVVGLSIGRPNGEECTPSFSNFVRLGERAQIHLQPVAYCLVVFRSTGIPPESLVEYTITAFTRSAAP